MRKDRKLNLVFRVTPQQRRALETIAFARGVRLSSLLREAVDEKIRRYGLQVMPEGIPEKSVRTGR